MIVGAQAQFLDMFITYIIWEDVVIKINHLQIYQIFHTLTGMVIDQS